jgi:hypothetical protein
MKAELTTGEIVELQKDCGCLHHDGPHWLYIDLQWHKDNRELLYDENGEVRSSLHSHEVYLAMRGYAIEELARLRNFGNDMKRHKIKRLIREPDSQ